MYETYQLEFNLFTGEFWKMEKKKKNKINKILAAN